MRLVIDIFFGIRFFHSQVDDFLRGPIYYGVVIFSRKRSYMLMYNRHYMAFSKSTSELTYHVLWHLGKPAYDDWL